MLYSLHIALALTCSGLVAADAGHDSADSTCGKQDSTDMNALLQSRSEVSKHKQDAPSASFLDQSTASMTSILQGITSKEEVELVLADYDEDMDWSDAYRHVRTTYCKGPKRTAEAKSNGCVPLPNVGREGHTFLHHIVENYDKLSKWTVFSQSGVPTAGYKGHRKGGGHMLPGVSFDSYLLDERSGGLSREDGAAFVFTGAVHMATLNHSLRFSYLKAGEAPSLHAQTECPQSVLLDGWQRWWDLGWFKKWIGKKCGMNKAGDLPAFFLKYWDEYMNMPRPDNGVVFFTQGARFAASRERIRQRPKEDYERIMKLLSTENDPCHNYLNEWIWYYMIGKPTQQPCSTDLLFFEGSKEASWQGAENILQEIQAKHLPLN
jgi:hypothetical protein